MRCSFNASDARSILRCEQACIGLHSAHCAHHATQPEVPPPERPDPTWPSRARRFTLRSAPGFSATSSDANSAPTSEVAWAGRHPHIAREASERGATKKPSGLSKPTPDRLEVQDVWLRAALRLAGHCTKQLATRNFAPAKRSFGTISAPMTPAASLERHYWAATTSAGGAALEGATMQAEPGDAVRLGQSGE